jgi:hypothetical protein
MARLWPELRALLSAAGWATASVAAWAVVWVKERVSAQVQVLVLGSVEEGASA